ncbi:MAG: winged helix-turn-helix domain-containing protein [Acidobacteriota bacterium]|nr:winged helix-turn-helix domain-containing protein [Acidobacteriota bacterium]
MEVKRFYEFGPFLLDPAERVLLRGGRPVPLTPKVLDILLVLVQNEGRLLNKKDLMEAVWPDSFVEEGNLTFNISALRKALGEDRKEHPYIETVPRRGYRFVASVRVLEAGVDDAGRRPVAQTAPAEGELPPRDEAGRQAENSDGAAVNGGGQDANETVGGVSALRTARAEPVPAGNGRRKKLAAFAALSIAAAAVTFGLYGLIGRHRSAGKPLDLFRGTTVTRLTTTRNATDAAISPDGRYVVYVVDEARQRSLWLRQVATNSQVQIIPPSGVYYLDLFFSRASDYAYYVTAEENRRPTLYQVPVTGGAPRKLLENMSGPVGLSPDGKRFAFVGGDGADGVALTVANAFDGSGAQKLITRKPPGFVHRPAWSPDGKVIACLAGAVTDAGRRVEIIEVRVADGAERPVTSQGWKFMERVEWLSDGSGLLATVSDYAYGPYQIWHVSYPGGEARRVTSDLSNYRSISLTSDSKTLVAVQSDIRPYVWVAADGDARRAQQITSGSGTGNDYWGFSWTPDGKIVYVSTLSGNQDIWIMNADGSNQKQLTFDGRSDFDPSVSPDGRYIAFASERSGQTKIWRMDSDGGNPKQLTTGSTGDFLPYYSPDGRWVVYTSADTPRMNLWKVPADGGEPTQVTRKTSAWPAVSPDGRSVACWHINEQTRSIGLAVVALDGGEPLKVFDISPSVNTWAEIRWTTDGRALTYVDSPNGVGNIWMQPLGGGPPRQLTDFKDNRIFRFDWSRDGQQLACSRGAETNDVVLISGLR